MDIALPLVGLHDKQVGDMSANVVLVAGSVAAKDLLESVSSQRRTRTVERVHTSESCEAPGRSSVS